jgi:hypothetical protein
MAPGFYKDETQYFEGLGAESLTGCSCGDSRLPSREGGAQTVYEKRQNSDVSPSERKSSWASWTVRRRQPGDRRSRYQASASFQVCSMLRVAPRGRRQAAHQRSIWASELFSSDRGSSDRKRSMVFQLKTMSSHQRRAGKAKCTMPDGSEVTAPSRTVTIKRSPQHPQEASTRPLPCSMAITPSASQMQLP